MSDAAATGTQGQGSSVAGAQSATAQPGQGQSGTEEAFDKDRALETIRRQRESEADAKRQLAEAVKRLSDAERERDELKTTTQTETERAIARAKRDGAAEVTARFQAQLRRAGVRTALVAAGMNPELLDLATKDDVFADLKVTDDGDIEGLDVAVSALRKARPSLFAKAGDFGGGQRGGTPNTPPTTNELLRAAIRG